MANGVLGKSMSSADTNVTVYTAPANTDFATVTISLVNLAAIEVLVDVAIGTSVVPALGDHIEYKTIIPPNGGILERSCMLMSANENVTVKAASSNVAIRVVGLEKFI
jgi:hypothetical protein